MALSKSRKLLLTISSIGAVGTVGLGMGLGLALSNSESNNVSDDNNFSTNTNPNSNNPSLASSINLVNLNNLLSQINDSSIVIHPYFTEEELKVNSSNKVSNSVVNTQKIVNKADIFAFNVAKSQLGLSSDVEIDSDVSVDLGFESSKNTVANLNSGKLSITIKLTQTGNNSVTKTIDLNGFKTPVNDLINLLSSSDESAEENNKTQLQITPANSSGQMMQYVSLEQLNSITDVASIPIAQSLREEDNELRHRTISDARNQPKSSTQEYKKETGLTTWLKKDTTKMLNGKDISVVGQVKLDKLETKNNKTYFYLSSANKNNPLKLIEKSDGKIVSEALVESIKTTNLLATDISIIPIGYDAIRNRTYIDELSKLNGENKYLTDSKNAYLNYTLSVDLTPKPEEERSLEKSINRLFIKPYLFIRSNDEDKKNKLQINVSITYGIGKDAKTFNTNSDDDLKALKAAGFKFNVYSKKLSSDQFSLSSKEITKEENKLSTFFKQENYKAPVTKPINGQNPMPMTGNFKLTTIPTEMDKGVIEIELGNEMIGGNEANSKSPKPENWLLFGDYSYMGMNEKVLFTPVIGLVHATTLNPSGAIIKTQTQSATAASNPALVSASKPDLENDRSLPLESAPKAEVMHPNMDMDDSVSSSSPVIKPSNENIGSEGGEKSDAHQEK